MDVHRFRVPRGKGEQMALMEEVNRELLDYKSVAEASFGCRVKGVGSVGCRV